jgi:acetylornithine deacetylase/succinyl-diaminopimelate desuccinylase-like protein
VKRRPPEPSRPARERGGGGWPGGALLLLCVLAGAPGVHAQPLDPGAISAGVRARLPDALALYRDLLRLPNDANHPEDIERVVRWLEGAFTERGFATERLETPGSPLLLAERTAPGADRTVLVYLQADTGGVSYGAFRTEYDAAPGVWLTAALTRLNGAEPIRVRTFGGSIPIAPFVATLGLPAVVVATVNPDNNQHSPNENLRVADFVAGIRTIVAVLQEPLPAGDGS